MDRFLSPSGLGVLRRTETIPLSLGWQKDSIHIAEYLEKDLEAGGAPNFPRQEGDTQGLELGIGMHFLMIPRSSEGQGLSEMALHGVTTSSPQPQAVFCSRERKVFSSFSNPESPFHVLVH